MDVRREPLKNLCSLLPFSDPLPMLRAEFEEFDLADRADRALNGVRGPASGDLGPDLSERNVVIGEGDRFSFFGWLDVASRPSTVWEPADTGFSSKLAVLAWVGDNG